MAKKKKQEEGSSETEQEIEEPDDDDAVTYGDLKRLLKGLPTVVRTQVYKFLGVELGPDEEEPTEERMREVLGGYPTFGEAIRDLRRRAEEKTSREDIIEDLKRYIDEEVVPNLRQEPTKGSTYDGSDLREILEGDEGLIERVRRLEARRDEPATGRKGRYDSREEIGKIKEVLIDLVKEVYQGMPNMQRYLNLLEDDRKA